MQTIRSAYLLAVVKALKVVVALENALLGLVSESVALVELLPEGVASAASCLPPQKSEMMSKFDISEQLVRSAGRKRDAIGIQVEAL